MIDSTTSMGPYIESTEENVDNIVHTVKKQFNDTPVRVGMVIYTHQKDEGSEKNGKKCKHFIIKDFTNDTNDIIKTLGQVKACGGGEDVRGALDKIINFQWKATNRVIIHIGRQYLQLWLMLHKNNTTLNPNYGGKYLASNISQVMSLI